MTRGSGIFKTTNASLFAITIGTALTFAACGGGGSSAVPTATISGRANNSTTTFKPGVRAASSSPSPISGWTVTAFDLTTGNACTLPTCAATTSTDPNSLGQFTLTVPGNNTYVIIISSMRTIITAGTGSGIQVTINPASEAAVEILETKWLNVPAGTLGTHGQRFDATINGLDINGDIQTIDNSAELTSVAEAILAALESCHIPQGDSGVQNALGHIEAHYLRGTSSGAATDTGTSSGTDTNSGTSTGTGTGSEGSLDSGNDVFCHLGGSGTDTSSGTGVGPGWVTGTRSTTGTSTASGTGTGTGSHSGTGTGTGTGSHTGTRTDTDTDHGDGDGNGDGHGHGHEH